MNRWRRCAKDIVADLAGLQDTDKLALRCRIEAEEYVRQGLTDVASMEGEVGHGDCYSVRNSVDVERQMSERNRDTGFGKHMPQGRKIRGAYREPLKGNP